MRYIINLVYACLLIACGPWLIWSAVKKGKYRQGWREKFLGQAPIRTGDGTCVWLHAVSVGEVNLLNRLVQHYDADSRATTLFISTTTQTGFELAKKKYQQHTVFYCPLDFSWAVSQAFQRIRPDLFVLAELELWPNLIDAAHGREIPVAIVNGRLSEKSFRGYRRIRPLLAKLLRKIDLIAVQNEEYRGRFQELGAKSKQLVVTGSLKFDGAEFDRSNPRTQTLQRLCGWTSDETVFVAGSTQSPEEQYCLSVFQQLQDQFPTLRLILVPRHPERFDEVARLLNDSGESWARRTELDATELDAIELDATELDTLELDSQKAGSPTKILLVDTVGELGSWWGLADLAFVGGSMGSRGGQNMIEPAAFGAAVSFGPNTKNFRDIVSALLQLNAAEVVIDQAELENFVRRGVESPVEAEQMGETARKFVVAQKGATLTTYKLLRHLIEDSKPIARKIA